MRSILKHLYHEWTRSCGIVCMNSYTIELKLHLIILMVIQQEKFQEIFERRMIESKRRKTFFYLKHNVFIKNNSQE